MSITCGAPPSEVNNNLGVSEDIALGRNARALGRLPIASQILTIQMIIKLLKQCLTTDVV